MMVLKILVYGGDKRRIYTAGYLAGCSHDVVLSGCSEDADAKLPENVKYENVKTALGYDAVVFPLPSFDESGKIRFVDENAVCCLHEILPIGASCKVFFAKGGKYESLLMRERALEYYDYFYDERLMTMNAVPTAEAAVSIYLSRSGSTVFSSSMCVVGYGRVGKALAKRLLALGADVTVCARSEKSIAEANSDCMKGEKISNVNFLSSFDCVFNTVPATVFSLSHVKEAKETLYIELASAPGGIEADALSFLGDRYISAPSLPGRFFPKLAGKFIGECINGHL